VGFLVEIVVVRADFLSHLGFVLPLIISPMLHTFSVFRGWYSMPVQGCTVKFLSLAAVLQLTNLTA
jgi:hypothetical protein